MIRIDTHNYILEQPEQHRAWDALILAGHKPEEYMYMSTYAGRATLDAAETHSFKHSLTRKYVHIGKPLRLMPTVLGSSQ